MCMKNSDCLHRMELDPQARLGKKAVKQTSEHAESRERAVSEFNVLGAQKHG